MENTTLVGEVYEIQPCIPRTTKRQEHHSNVEAIRVSLYWKRSLYPPFIDHLINELDTKLVKSPLGFHGQLYIPGK